MFKALELIPLVHVIIHNYVRDEVTKDELLQLIADLVPRASRASFINLGDYYY